MKRLNNMNEKKICTLFGMVMLAAVLMTCPALAAGSSYDAVVNPIMVVSS